jgi:hypothetical protein
MYRITKAFTTMSNTQTTTTSAAGPMYNPVYESSKSTPRSFWAWAGTARFGAISYLTRNSPALTSVPRGVVTLALPEVAPDGTVALISVADMTVNCAGVPLNVTRVAPVRSVPRILTVAPTLPAAGSVLTNGPRPADILYIVPLLPLPPKMFIP